MQVIGHIANFVFSPWHGRLGQATSSSSLDGCWTRGMVQSSQYWALGFWDLMFEDYLHQLLPSCDLGVQAWPPSEEGRARWPDVALAWTLGMGLRPPGVTCWIPGLPAVCSMRTQWSRYHPVRYCHSFFTFLQPREMNLCCSCWTALAFPWFFNELRCVPDAADPPLCST